MRIHPDLEVPSEHEMHAVAAELSTGVCHDACVDKTAVFAKLATLAEHYRAEQNVHRLYARAEQGPDFDFISET